MKKLVFFLIRSYFRVFNSIEVSGLENIPSEGSLIMACNHLSNCDPPVVISFVSIARSVRIMAKKELFTLRPLAWFFSWFGAIPVDRAAGGDISAIKKSLEILSGGGCLLVFPEGTRAKGRNLQPKAGISYLAHKSGAPVLPVRIFNSENFTKLGRIVVVFGKPMSFTGFKGKESYLEFSKKIMDDIFSLKTEKVGS